MFETGQKRKCEDLCVCTAHWKSDPQHKQTISVEHKQKQKQGRKAKHGDLLEHLFHCQVGGGRVRVGKDEKFCAPRSSNIPSCGSCLLSCENKIFCDQTNHLQVISIYLLGCLTGQARHHPPYQPNLSYDCARQKLNIANIAKLAGQVGSTGGQV